MKYFPRKKFSWEAVHCKPKAREAKELEMKREEQRRPQLLHSVLHQDVEHVLTLGRRYAAYAQYV